MMHGEVAVIEADETFSGHNSAVTSTRVVKPGREAVLELLSSNPRSMCT